MKVMALAITVVALARGGAAQEVRMPINDASFSAMQTWVEAVRSHTPGQADAAVTRVAAFSYQTRVDLNAAMPLFLDALLGWPYNTQNNKAAQAIAALGRGAGRDLLKRAAVLHSDVAAYGDLYPRLHTTVVTPAKRRTEEIQTGHGGSTKLTIGDPPPPLLMEDRVLLDADGNVVGEAIGTWNWPFARSLLDLVDARDAKGHALTRKPEPATDPFVGAWYHATTAYMFARGLYADATPHLAHAALVLPNDPFSRFDRACYAEILGLPMHQVLVREPNANDRAHSASAGPTWTTPGTEDALHLPPARETNADAERLFRQTLDIAPDFGEARVRLARLLQERGRYDEASAELTRAFEGKLPPVVAFLAHLLAGRAAQELGRPADAARHNQEARTLFPDAQSARLASSAQALLDSDVGAALDHVRQLGPRSATFSADPWWQYHLAAGRDADTLLKAMWSVVPR